MEEELGTLQEDLNATKDAYAADALALSITLKYVASIIGNKRVQQYLTKHHPDLLRELQETTQGAAA
jgi:hypothetical protein